MLTNENGERLYTTADVAEKLGMSRERVVCLIKRGELNGVKRSVRIDNHTANLWIVTQADLDDYRHDEIGAYIKEKLKILRQLKIELTYNQLEHMRNCKTEFEVDAFYHDIITRKTKIK